MQAPRQPSRPADFHHPSYSGEWGSGEEKQPRAALPAVGQPSWLQCWAVGVTIPWWTAMMQQERAGGVEEQSLVPKVTPSSWQTDGKKTRGRRTACTLAVTGTLWTFPVTKGLEETLLWSHSGICWATLHNAPSAHISHMSCSYFWTPVLRSVFARAAFVNGSNCEAEGFCFACIISVEKLVVTMGVTNSTNREAESEVFIFSCVATHWFGIQLSM